MKISFGDLDLAKKGTLVVTVAEDRAFLASAAQVDSQAGGALSRAASASRFTGKFGQTLEILAPAGLDAGRVILLGLGKLADLTEAKAESLGATVYAAVATQPETHLSVALDPLTGDLTAATFAARLAHGLHLRTYRFDKYLTKQKAEDKPTLEKVAVLLADHAAAKKAYGDLAALAEAVFYARDLVTEPGNILNPETYADRLKDLSKQGLEVEVLTVKDMKKLGMGSLLGVGQGSNSESRVVILRWNGGKDGAAPVAFVGKGVTFDSGGLSLKPAKSMEDMKWDMGGSAAVVGTLLALAGRKAKVNAVGVVGLVENMPSATAQRPGDVVTSMSGQTIEVLNTDAEGRLVLADVLWYTQDRFKPVAMINLATLTGAIIIALGHEHAGLFSNNDALSDAILAAGKDTGETLWRMPLGEAYDALLKSPIADMKNIGDGSAGSAVAAVFLQRFVNDVPWAHLDIAGVAWSGKDKGVVPKGATGWGVRLLDQLVKSKYEA
ncbi:putative cytosol aminopeptidase [Elstera cyanobacteriorum]|uniref:Probable cytosol aminopeptidase n=1 Tax=Elstera cyanobacteriorum TaxID=2022747 RepID=A0A255XNU7_9PROT|nr:leucyl aminopeptidase [Elstera cyanobacteriorum]OYQ18561.1 leucyl aminopeptidase [Elstera cyanobacteriorum]GFZ79389.1 putative cytosol aminopeptidase [Elstera cyanobacteriorum]